MHHSDTNINVVQERERVARNEARRKFKRDYEKLPIAKRIPFSDLKGLINLLKKTDGDTFI